MLIADNFRLEVKDGYIVKIALPNAEGKPALPAPILPKTQTAFKKPAVITTMPPKLTWEVVRAETFDGDKKFRLVIKAQNRTSERVDFKYIRLGIRSNDKGDQPFASRQWSKKASSATTDVKPESAGVGRNTDAAAEKQPLPSETTTKFAEKAQASGDKKALENLSDNLAAPTPASKVLQKEGEAGLAPIEGAIATATDIYSVTIAGGGGAAVSFTNDVIIVCAAPSYQLGLRLEGKPKILGGPGRGFSTKNDAAITFEFEGILGAKGDYRILIHESWSLEDDSGNNFTEDELLFRVD